MCSELQHSEEAQGGDLNHTAVLLTENVFLQGPSRPVVVLQGRIRSNLITVRASSGLMSPSHNVCGRTCVLVLAGNQFSWMKESSWEQQRTE